MQTSRLLQAVILMMMVASAASCATSNEYVNKIFKPRGVTTEPVMAKKESKPVKFLEFDSAAEESEEWVKINTTDTTRHTDTVALAKASVKTDTTNTTPIISDPLVKSNNPDGTRSKKSRE